MALLSLLGSSSSSCEIRMPASEPDSQPKAARVYLSKSAMGSSSSNGSKEGSEDDAEGFIPHWAICVEFYEYGFWVLMEGVQNGGKLRACYQKFTARPLGQLYKFKDVTFLGIPACLPNIFNCNISPQKLHSIAKNHPLNENIYNILTMRCYEWALKAAHLINDNI